MTKGPGPAASARETVEDVGEGQAVEPDGFLPRSVAPKDGDGAAREAKGRGEKLAQRLVGAPLDRRRVDLYLERFTEPADDLAAGGVGDGFDRERAGGRRHRFG